MTTNSPIPASPIPQTPQKIGTRYVAVSREADAKTTRCYTSDAYFDLEYPTKAYQACDIYMLLDPSDAAELERLREAKYQAELDMRTTAMSRDVPTAVSPRVWNAWITACDRLSAFEKTIGGGS